MDYAAMGNHIRTLRRKQKITQEALAMSVGISASFLGHIERGTRIASIETLVAICNTLDVSPELLLCDSLHLSSPAMLSNLSGQDVAQLRKHLQIALEVVDRLGC